MSSYDVKCPQIDCVYYQHVFEVNHKMSEPHGKCLGCGALLITHFTKDNTNPVQFKGDHWVSGGHGKRGY